MLDNKTKEGMYMNQFGKVSALAPPPIYSDEPEQVDTFGPMNGNMFIPQNPGVPVAQAPVQEAPVQMMQSVPNVAIEQNMAQPVQMSQAPVANLQVQAQVAGQQNQGFSVPLVSNQVILDTPVVAQQPVQEQPREQTEWEKLGISEYDYYNSPMWSWARVDYSVKTYGSFDATHQACINAGNQLEDILSFSCTNINSYSGNYLGDMLRVKY